LAYIEKQKQKLGLSVERVQLKRFGRSLRPDERIMTLGSSGELNLDVESIQEM